MLAAVVIMVFLVVFGLTISATYFLVEAPASRKRLRLRVEAVRQSAAGPMVTAEGLVFRQDALSRIPFLDRFLFDIPGIRPLQQFVQQSGVSLAVDRLLVISLGLAMAAGLAGLLLEMPWPLVGVMMVLPAALPFIVIGVKRYQRLSKFEELFPDAMDLLARAVRAGHAFTTALELIATEMPEPLASEFRTTYDQQNLGLPLRDALYNLTVRVPSPDVRIFVTALQIQRESGGNLAEILDNLSYVVRERFKLYRQIKTLTAEGRMSMYFLMALPPITALGLGLANPEYVAELFVEPLGHKMLVAGVILQTIGYFVIRRIIRMKV
jgi:tight adherence protein B